MGRSKRPEKAAKPAFAAKDVIADALERDPRVAGVLASFGLPCDQCVVKDFETLAEGCAPLGLSVDEVLARLNALSEDAAGPA
jgi:hybrid cluster-associated redox disulfide protein